MSKLTPPLPVTLKKYGLTIEMWLKLAESQGHACAVCKQVPTNGRLNIDHYHAKGWKKMQPERRVDYVRGLLCYRCNNFYVGKSITVERSKNVTAYLESFDRRKPPEKRKA